MMKQITEQGTVIKHNNYIKLNDHKNQVNPQFNIIMSTMGDNRRQN